MSKKGIQEMSPQTKPFACVPSGCDVAIRRVLAGLIAAVAIAGCTAQGSATSPKPTPSQAAKPTPTATPTEDSPSVEQFSSIVARYHADWDQKVAELEEDCVDPELILACSIGYTTLGYVGKTIKLDLAGSYDPSSNTYLGEPPTEIAGLLDETVVSAGDVGSAAAALSAAPCVDPLAPKCRDEKFRLEMAISDMSAQFDAWAPYGG